MAKKMNYKFIKNKWIKWGGIPLLLFGIWFLLTMWTIIIYDHSFLIISYDHSAGNFTKITHNQLLKGQALTGTFVAPEDNLGIVAMRFKSFQRIPYNEEDTLVFRIKEKGQKNWYYQNTYRSGLTYDVPFLPFGFPIISNSQGKTYQFELQSLHGNNINGVVLSTRQPFLVSKYKADKTTLLHDPHAMLTFIYKKITNSLQTIDISYSSFLFILPLIFYFLLTTRTRKFIPKYTLPLVIILLVLIDIFFYQILNDLLYMEVPILWLLTLRSYNFDSRYTFGTGLFFLIFAPIYLQLNIENTAEVAAAWAFMFFVAGLLQSVIALKYEKD